MSEQPNELDMLKERASQLGIKGYANMKLETLKEKINAKLEPKQKKDLGKAGAKLTAKQKARKEALKLERVMVTNMDPNRSKASGILLTHSGRGIGTVKRFVPYNVETHVEKVLLARLREKEFQQHIQHKGDNGKFWVESKLVSSHAINVLPQLTPQELKDLAAQQAKNQSID